MNSSTLHHIILILGLYIILFISNYGWGVLTAKYILKLNPYLSNGYFFYAVWTGWCTTLFVLQLVHFFFAIDWKISGFIYLVGIALAAGSIITNAAKIKISFQRNDMIYTIFFLVMILCVAIWIDFRGMRIPRNYDSGLYHLNLIRWINSYPIIPGLGNLHSRLAFNQTFFIYAASLNFSPYFPYANSVANGFLFLLLTAELIWRLILLIQRWRDTIRASVYAFIPHVFGLFIVIWWAAAGKDMSSPTPDLASFFIQLTLFFWFIQIILIVRDHNIPDELIPFLCILAVTLVTVKISNLIFAFTLIGMCIIYTLKISPKRYFFQKNMRSFVFLFAVLLVWVISGYYSSGYPFYPLSFGSLPFSWTIPPEKVKGLADIIYSWARMPRLTPNQVLGNWQWLHPWLLRIYEDYKLTVIYPIYLSVTLIIISVAIAFTTRKLHLFLSESIFFIPTAASLLFWFFSAPEPRFANALFFLFLLNAIILFLSRLYDLIGVKLGLTLTAIIVLIFAVRLFQFVYPVIIDDLQNRYAELPQQTLVRKRTDSGLTVYIPVIGDQCWDALLPCTPYYDPKLRLLVSGDLSSGFTVK